MIDSCRKRRLLTNYSNTENGCNHLDQVSRRNSTCWNHILTASAAFPPFFNISIPAVLHIELSLATAPKLASSSATAGDVVLHEPGRIQDLNAGKKMNKYKIAAVVVMAVLTISIPRLDSREFGLDSEVGGMRSYTND
jgi:hypothetical protein